MITLRQSIWLAAFVLILGFCASVFAQVTNTPPVTPSNPFPIGKDAAWIALIPLLTFIVTWIFGKIKSLPNNILPLLTPILGWLFGWIIEKATHANFPWWSEAGAGAVSVMIYEAIKNLTNAGPSSALTPTPEPPK